MGEKKGDTVKENMRETRTSKIHPLKIHRFSSIPIPVVSANLLSSASEVKVSIPLQTQKCSKLIWTCFCGFESCPTEAMLSETPDAE